MTEIVTNNARKTAEDFLAQKLQELTPGYDTKPVAKAVFDLQNVTRATIDRWDKQGHTPTSMSLDDYNALRAEYGYPPIKEIN